MARIAILKALELDLKPSNLETPESLHQKIPRDIAFGDYSDILNFRKREIWPYFERKFTELIESVNGNSNDFRVTTLDYVDCLRIIEEDSVIYSDPPYQSAHYSRFYHAIETLVKYDYPEVSYKGRYRNDRHQSPFCKKTTVDNAFSMMFEGVALKRSHLALSYSDTGMIDLKTIIDISKKHMVDYTCEVLEKDHIHSTMGRSDEKNQEHAIFNKSPILN